MAENKSIKSFAFPLITAFFSVLNLIWMIRRFQNEFDGVLLIPCISGILCSVIAICLIKKYELNIFRYWKIFLLNVVIGAVVFISSFFGFWEGGYVSCCNNSRISGLKTENKIL